MFDVLHSCYPAKFTKIQLQLLFIIISDSKLISRIFIVFNFMCAKFHTIWYKTSFNLWDKLLGSFSHITARDSVEGRAYPEYTKVYLPSILLYNTPVPHTNSIKLLGLTLEPQLSWLHPQAKCLRNLNVLKFLSHLTNGCNLSTLVHLYKVLIGSIIGYM